MVLRVEHLSKSYERPLFQDLTLDILRGEKWAVLGPNGCGKTTFIRCLLGQIAPDAGRIVLGTGVKVAYFDQLLQCLDASQLVVEAIRPAHKEFVEGQRRDLLARYGITGDMVFQRVESLSGGERNRTALAYLAALDANLLILDEPTNHLDLWARAALEKAIRKFDGTVLLVSHDRYFLNQVADHLIVMQQGELHVDRRKLRHVPASGEPGSDSGPDRLRRSDDDEETRPKRPERERPERRKRKFPYRKVEDLEADIQPASRASRNSIRPWPHPICATDNASKNSSRTR